VAVGAGAGTGNIPAHAVKKWQLFTRAVPFLRDSQGPHFQRAQPTQQVPSPLATLHGDSRRTEAEAFSRTRVAIPEEDIRSLRGALCI